MEFNLKNFLAKILKKPTKEQQTLMDEEQQQRQAERIQWHLEKQISELDTAAKLNLLDAQLSARNIDTLLKSGELGDDKDNIIEAQHLKAIAQEQEAFNFDYLTKSAEREPAERIDIFSKNSIFSSASQVLNRGYDNVLGLEENGRAYRVYPINHAGQDIVTDSVIIKLQNMINGMDKKEMVETLSKMMSNQSSAIEFAELLSGKLSKKIDTARSITSTSYGNERRLFTLAVECAEHTFQQRMAEQQKTQQDQVLKGNSGLVM